MSHKETKGKLKLNLVPPRSIRSIAQVREFGNKKYKDPWGWIDSVSAEDLVEATGRHLLQIHMNGYDHIDNESGLLHLEHALCSLAMAVELIKLEEEEN